MSEGAVTAPSSMFLGLWVYIKCFLISFLVEVRPEKGRNLLKVTKQVSSGGTLFPIPLGF